MLVKQILRGGAQRLREWAVCMLQHVLKSVSRSEGCGKALDELNIIWFYSSAATSFCSRGSDSIMQHLNGNGNKDRGRVRARGGVGCWWGGFSNMWGERASLQQKQMLDVSRYTASPADQDIIFIQPEVPFMLIGAAERRRGAKGEDQRWDDSRGKKGAIGACCLLAARGGCWGKQREELG